MFQERLLRVQDDAMKNVIRVVCGNVGNTAVAVKTTFMTIP